jgi:hypothetical protein
MQSYPDNEEEEQEDLVEKNVELNAEAQEEYAEDNSPTYSKPEDLYSLFWKTIEIEDSSKVGNLDKTELGMLDMSVRDCQHIAITARILNEEEFAKWMDKQAQVILKTSASKKGWLTELFVTAKRFASKEKRMGINEQMPMNPKPGFWDKFKK